MLCGRGGRGNDEGKDRKAVTSRKYAVSARSSGRAGVVYFFTVVAWW